MLFIGSGRYLFFRMEIEWREEIRHRTMSNRNRIQIMPDSVRQRDYAIFGSQATTWSALTVKGMMLCFMLSAAFHIIHFFFFFCRITEYP